MAAVIIISDVRCAWRGVSQAMKDGAILSKNAILPLHNIAFKHLLPVAESASFEVSAAKLRTVSPSGILKVHFHRNAAPESALLFGPVTTVYVSRYRYRYPSQGTSDTSGTRHHSFECRTPACYPKSRSRAQFLRRFSSGSVLILCFWPVLWGPWMTVQN